MDANRKMGPEDKCAQRRFCFYFVAGGAVRLTMVDGCTPEFLPIVADPLPFLFSSGNVVISNVVFINCTSSAVVVSGTAATVCLREVEGALSRGRTFV